MSNDNHLGDLLTLYIDHRNSWPPTVLSYRLKSDDVKDHALMTHTGGDDHSDHPKPLGSNGERLICGVIS
ncbi:superoxide dismutase family protein [Plesiomonas shigelloides]|uniref:superoxide dismutase family protein n=1 Tax=Plesiomonas shigelloides TaxID=703 RepID=UPI001C49B26B|nr:superoxide dismutase family protein [Plesiomonas shigelloides]